METFSSNSKYYRQNKSLVLHCYAGRQTAVWPRVNGTLQRQRNMYLCRFGVQKYN